MNNPKSDLLSRRRLFAGAGTAGALAAVAVALPALKPAEDAAVATSPKPAPDRGGGYRVTQHVLDYYQTTRI